MVAIRILCLLFCGCFVNVSSQSTLDETSSLCAWNNEQFMLQIFDRTCGRSQQLLKEMKQSMDSMSAQMMTIKGPTEGNVDEKRQLVSALTGKCVCKSFVIFANRICSPVNAVQSGGPRTRSALP